MASYVIELRVAPNMKIPLSEDRLKAGFQGYLDWRHELTKQGRQLSPIRTDFKPWFTGLWGHQHKPENLEGQSRSMGAQLGIVYEGCFRGYDALGFWEVHPVGSLVEAVICPCNSDTGEVLVGEWELDDSIAENVVHFVRVTNEAPASKLKSEWDNFMELHKLTSFVSWFEQRNNLQTNAPLKWEFFPSSLAEKVEQASADELTDLQKRILRVMCGDTMHRGFVLHGPAGTGKTWSIQGIMRFLRLHSNFGWSRDGEPIVGTGAVLKGGLQGDLEMKIFALFMRCEAAPWLPCAISVDEIDFTAPSRRDQVSSTDSGGNLWLLKLSGQIRPKNMVFFGTTNVLFGVLEQLVDRLDPIYVGLQSWDQTSTTIERLVVKKKLWPEAMLIEPTREASLARCFQYEDFLGIPKSCSYYSAVFCGMTPRALENLRSIDTDLVREVQESSNPWPTLTQGNLTIRELLRSYVPQGDCRLLFEFLTQKSIVITGRLVIDLTRLRQGLVIVEVEVRLKQSNELGIVSVLPTGAQTKSGFQYVQGGSGTDETTTRTFVLTGQRSEAGVWGVLALVAVDMKVDHCTYASTQFLSIVGGSHQHSADERNRDSLRNALDQFVKKSKRCVMVVPLSLARIQRSGDGESFGSSTIHASEVWELLINEFRVGQFVQGEHHWFALVAHEKGELYSIHRNNDAMSWPTNAYREHMISREEEEAECVHCKRWYNRKSKRDVFGCNHPAGNGVKPVIRYVERVPRVDKLSKDVIDMVPASAASDWANPETPMRAKWMCCGKAFLEKDCPNTPHVEATRFEALVNSGAHANVFNRSWWCNMCGQSVDKAQCSAI